MFEQRSAAAMRCMMVVIRWEKTARERTQICDKCGQRRDSQGSAETPEYFSPQSDPNNKNLALCSVFMVCCGEYVVGNFLLMKHAGSTTKGSRRRSAVFRSFTVIGCVPACANHSVPPISDCGCPPTCMSAPPTTATATRGPRLAHAE